MNKLKFFLHFLKDRDIACLAPTSLPAVKKVCAPIDFKRDVTVVEYGPGDGVFCRYLLSKMTKNSKLIAIETNAELVANLQKQIDDPRFFVRNDSAENVVNIVNQFGLPGVDYVISGIPFSFFDQDKKDRIVANTYKSLNSHGAFLVYQYSKHVMPTLQQHFDKVGSQFILRNLPPMQFMMAEK